MNDQKYICSKCGTYDTKETTSKNHNYVCHKCYASIPSGKLETESKIFNRITPYPNYTFCKAVNCPVIKDKFICEIGSIMCIRTAKEFHCWLTDNGYKIIKEINDGHF